MLCSLLSSVLQKHVFFPFPLSSIPRYTKREEKAPLFSVLSKYPKTNFLTTMFFLWIILNSFFDQAFGEGVVEKHGGSDRMKWEDTNRVC
jgi:hypothetical protein